MAYQKQTWVDGASGRTPINATRLNHMEDGIYNASYDDVYSTDEVKTNKVWIDGNLYIERLFLWIL